MPQGATAAKVLDLAAQQNHCYLPTYRKFSIGRYIVSICGVAQDNAKRQYWIIYVNGAPAQYGVDDLIPNNGDRITFKYVKLNWYQQYNEMQIESEIYAITEAIYHMAVSFLVTWT